MPQTNICIKCLPSTRTVILLNQPIGIQHRSASCSIVFNKTRILICNRVFCLISRVKYRELLTKLSLKNEELKFRAVFLKLYY